MTQPLEEMTVIAGADRPAAQPQVRIEPSPRWVRAFVGSQPIADSKRVLLVFEPKRLPVYYFPTDDVRMDWLRPSDFSTSRTTPTMRWNLEVEGRQVENVGWSYPAPDGERLSLKDHVAFYWNKLDAWYEEEDQVFVHPRDPYHRVDVLQSSRHVKVMLDGEVLAESSRPRLLFETGLPTRYYLPPLDVRRDLLEASDTVTQCPYKGRAHYYSVRSGERFYKDFVWYYAFPIPECPKIENHFAFYNEKVDIYVDGQLESRPTTQWS
jgi:uncharacterized protein (DUF427 family)